MTERNNLPVRDLLKGKKVRLAAIRDEDFEILARWYGDGITLRFYEIEPAYPYGSSSIKKWVEENVASGRHFAFGIRDTEDDRLVGYADLNDIVWNNSVASLSIAIGDAVNRGKGYASEALELLLGYGFQELNLHRIQLSVISYNESAIALYEKVGFCREGCQREVIHRDGIRFDLYNYGLLRHEWAERH